MSSQGSDSIAFTCDSDHQRMTQRATIAGATATTTYLNDPVSGAQSLSVQSAGGISTTDYLSVDGQIVGQRVMSFAGASTWGSGIWGNFQWGASAQSKWGSSTWGQFNWSGLSDVAFGYFSLDHLGSVAVVTDAAGAVVQRLSYDAWGKQRNPNGTPAQCGSISSPTTRGFTNQEQVPGGCLVNLNARLYDPEIGRMMSPDPVVGSPFMPQQLNRYSYVINNPLSLTDPSGMCFLGCFWKSSIFKVILSIALAAVLDVEILALEGVGGGTFSGALAAVASGASIPTGAGLLAAGISGGIAGAITGGGKGALLGVLQGVLFFGAGSLVQAEPNLLGSPLITTFVAHGFVGGITSAIGGGKFGSGFLAGGVGSLGPAPVANEGWEQIAVGTVESAVLGGAGSLLGGGKFENGAITGAFGYLFNAEEHQAGYDALIDKYQAVIKYGNIDIDADVRQARTWGASDDVSSFVNAVRTGGNWDFKDLPAFANFSNKDLLADFGNFHFGIVADAFGYPEGIAIAGAGAYQSLVQGQSASTRLSGTVDFVASVLSTNPLFLLWNRAAVFEAGLGMRYGDRPEDTAAIVNGYNYYGAHYGH